jgi:hypothetical protein
MRKTHVVLGLAVATALAVACSSSSSGPTTYAISGTCGPLNAQLVGTAIALSGPCALGPAGNYTLDAGLLVNLGACGETPVAITADFIQSSTALVHSTFSGQAAIPCNDAGSIDITKPIDVGGTFLYSGGTGVFVDATGSADAGGAVTASLSGFTAELALSGSLTY